MQRKICFPAGANNCRCRFKQRIFAHNTTIGSRFPALPAPGATGGSVLLGGK